MSFPCRELNPAAAGAAAVPTTTTTTEMMSFIHAVLQFHSRAPQNIKLCKYLMFSLAPFIQHIL